MTRADVPVLFLSAEALDGRPVHNPVFVAVPVTAGLCGQLADAGNGAGRHPPQSGRPVQVRLRHTDLALYWDFKADTALDMSLEEHVDWLVTPHRAQAELWGRQQFADGGFSGLQPLVRSKAVHLALLQQIGGAGAGLAFDHHPGWSGDAGEPFALVVHQRLSTFSGRSPP